MAVIALNIPEQVADRVIGALCRHGGYMEQVDSPNLAEPRRKNPVSRQQFAKQILLDYVMNIVGEVEAQEARERSVTEARERVKNEIKIT